MTINTETRPTTTDVSATEGTVQATTAPVRAGRLSALRAAISTRRAQRSELSRQIAAYPASRGAGAPVVPANQRVATPSSRFWV